MNASWIILSLAVGAVLGAFCFGGLWITVRRLPVTQHAGLLLLVSFVLRSAVVLLGFYVIIGGGWQPLIVCLAGFLGTRTLFIRRLRIVEQQFPPTGTTG